MILHMLYHSNGLTLIDDIASLDNKLFRVSLELVECVWLYFFQDSNYCTTSKPSVLNQFANEVISNFITNFLSYREGLIVDNSHSSSLFQLLLATDSIHRTSHHTELYFRNLQMIIQLYHSLINQFVSLEVNSIVCLMVNLPP